MHCGKGIVKWGNSEIRRNEVYIVGLMLFTSVFFHKALCTIGINTLYSEGIRLQYPWA